MHLVQRFIIRWAPQVRFDLMWTIDSTRMSVNVPRTRPAATEFYFQECAKRVDSQGHQPWLSIWLSHARARLPKCVTSRIDGLMLKSTIQFSDILPSTKTGGLRMWIPGWYVSRKDRYIAFELCTTWSRSWMLNRCTLATPLWHLRVLLKRPIVSIWSCGKSQDRWQGLPRTCRFWPPKLNYRMRLDTGDWAPDKG